MRHFCEAGACERRLIVRWFFYQQSKLNAEKLRTNERESVCTHATCEMIIVRGKSVSVKLNGTRVYTYQNAASMQIVHY